MATWKGIDVSRHQGAVDFAKVKSAGVQFVILRAGFGRETSQKDTCFESNYAKAKAAGLPVGAYWYSYANSPEDARKEAKACLEVIKGKQFEFPVWYDIEYEPDILAMTRAARTECVKAFCDTLEAAGYYSGVYCSRDFLANKLDAGSLKAYDVWVAAYTGSSTPGNVALPYGMWQYSSTGKVNGVSGNVDMDYAYKDYASIITKAGLNGFSKEAHKPVLYNVALGSMTKGDADKFVALANSLKIECKLTKA